jgi:hypothetical protein
VGIFLLERIREGGIGDELVNDILRVFDAMLREIEPEALVPLQERLIQEIGGVLEVRQFVQGAIRVLLRLSARGYALAVLESGLFGKVMEIVERDASVGVIEEAARLGTQMLYSAKDDAEAGAEILRRIPVEFFGGVFLEKRDPRVATGLLPLFANVMAVDPGMLFGLAEPPALAVLCELLENSKEAIRRPAVSCLWHLMKHFPLDRVKVIAEYENGAMLTFLMDSFDSDSVTFLRSALIPCVLGLVAHIRESGREQEEPFAQFLASIENRLVELSYLEDQKEIESLAASLLKIIFPATYERQGFV